MFSSLSVLIAYLSLVSPSLGAPKTLVGRDFTAPDVIPSVWQVLGVASPSAPLDFTFSLASERSPSEFDAKIASIAADPNAQWLTRDQVAAFVAPSAAAKSALETAIQGIPGATYEYNVIGDKITVHSNVAQASKFFGATFNNYIYNGDSSLTAIRTLSFTVPSAIAPYVTDVSPIATFGTVKVLNKPLKRDVIDNAVEKRGTPSSCSTSKVTLPCIRALYGYDTYVPPKAGTATAVGILGFIGQNYSPLDLDKYLKAYRPEAEGYKICVNTSNGAVNNALDPGVEADLDTQTIAGIIYPLPSTFYDIGNMLTGGDVFLLSFQNFLNMSTRPAVTTYSYGSEEDQFTTDQANTMCNSAKQLAAMGMTIVASSGDSGVNGQGQSGDKCPPFIPTYPGGCPYILSVGATQGFSPEVAVDTTLAGFYSGAGYSNIFPTPSYQSAQVAAYQAKLAGSQPGIANPGGRSFPDVAAQGSQQAIYSMLLPITVGGTSASAPITAGGIALLNDLLTASGKRTAGWIQPMIYGAASTTYTDVTSGGSYGCTNTTAGLPALPGWDSSMGLGTPVFANLCRLYGV